MMISEIYKIEDHREITPEIELKMKEDQEEDNLKI